MYFTTGARPWPIAAVSNVTTPPHQAASPVKAPADQDGPPKLEHHERAKIRNAAYRATQVYPGPVGQLVSRELLIWEEMGWRLGHGTNALVNRLVDDVTRKAGPQ